MVVEKKGWKHILPGGLTEAGSSKKFHTGDWRSKFPVRNDKCIHCLMCAAYCPEDCILVKDGKMSGFDYDYCKGCGICAKVCPVHAISMHEETRFEEYKKDPDAFMKKLEETVKESKEKDSKESNEKKESPDSSKEESKK